MDDVVDREIGRALAVEPSADFVARVRRRVAAEPAPRRTTAWWVAPAALALAAAIVVAVRVPQSSTPVRVMLPADAIESSVSVPALRGMQHAPDRAPSRPAAVDTTPEPVVLIDPREARAIRSFLDAVGAGRLDPPAPTAAGAAVEITIAPLVIDPLPAPPPEGVSR